MNLHKKLIVIPRIYFRNFCTKQRKPVTDDYIKEMPIFQYATSRSDKRRVYVWGNAKTGALGILKLMRKDSFDHINYISYPTRLPFAERYSVKAAAAGFGFSAFAVDTEEGQRVFGTGLNRDSQIGCHTVRKDKYLEILFYPQEIYIPFSNASTVKILKLSAGRAHLAVLTNEGLYMLGNNSYGQCGRSIIKDEDYGGSKHVHLIPSLDGEKIVDVVCGQDHTVALTERGRVYSCGWGADGQTGLEHFKTYSKLTRLLGDIENEKIVKVSSVCDFVLAMNSSGDVFGWGNNEYSQMDESSNYQQVSKPTHIGMCKELGRIIDVAAGGCFCMVLNEDGFVYTWGFGLLGAGPEVQIAKKPMRIPPQLFGFNDFNPSVKVRKINCGLGHMAAITNYGDLYIWGKNRERCLGLANEKDQYFPLKVALGGSVTDVMCGLDHTLAICKPFI